ncbi:MAG: hypothetical protein LLG97_20890 [Deltaproteobacteria bacterium]|nr:hypothetical protein [Deltaproteobacteria bacterium]
MLSKSLRNYCGAERMTYGQGIGASDYSDIFDFSNYSLLTSLDYIILNIFDPIDAYNLFKVIEDYGFKVVSDQILNKGNYERKRIYRNIDRTLEFLYRLRDEKSSVPPVRMHLRHPDQEMILIFSEIIQRCGLRVLTSVVEVTFDFCGKNLQDLMDFFHYRLFVRYQKSRPFRFEGERTTTFYPEDCRSSESKGMREYRKKFDDGSASFRFELVLKRRILRRLGLEFPLSNIDEINWLSFFDFRQLDLDGLRDYLIWLQRKSIAEEALQPRIWRGSAIVSYIDYCHRPLLDNDLSLMEKMRLIKTRLNVRNYARFLIPLDRINQRFMTMVRAQRFIPDRRKRRL